MLRMTMVFNVGRYSWSEAHMWNGTGTPLSSAAIQAAADLANARAAVLANPAQIRYVRISSYPANRLVFDWIPATTILGQVNQNVAGDPTQVSVLTGASVANFCLIVDAFGANGNTTRMYLAGVPTGVFQEPGVGGLGFNFVAVPGFGGAIGTWFNFLSSNQNNFGWLTRVGAVNFLPALTSPATNILYPNSVGIVLNGAGLGNIAPNTPVQVKGWRKNTSRSPGLSGVYRTAGLPLPSTQGPPTTTHFLQNTGQVEQTQFYAIGQLGLLNTTFVAYNQLELAGATSRKRGNRIGAPRGRSSIRV